MSTEVEDHWGSLAATLSDWHNDRTLKTLIQLLSFTLTLIRSSQVFLENLYAF